MDIMFQLIFLVIFFILPILVIVAVVKVVRRMDQRAEERLRLEKENATLQHQQMKEITNRITKIEKMLKEVD
ncbi:MULTISPECIES: hypothetical protein [Bacillaceae]|uniref:Phage shock protein B n=1 Tax=Evansella alkalicola TaxID=745819 RepID=A0ABS6JV21_9BACI|nr:MULTISPECIES: hypothetical protein [Bacillaceae]MBU9722420.1 hypothetical protein [Bacillus alkalicola]